MSIPRFRFRLSRAGLMIAVLIGATGGRVHADCISTPPGLIGWWPGDGNASNVLGTNHGTLQGGATANATGMVGQAFSFDGTNGFVQVANSPILQPATFTIEAWVKFNGLDSPGTAAAGDQYIVFKQNTRATDFEGFDLSKTRESGTDYFRFLAVSASGQIALLRSATAVSNGVWYHVAAVRGSNFMQLYVNGVLERQTNVTFAQSYGNFPLYFGTSGQAFWDRKLRGELDEVALFNRACSGDEIAAIHTAGAAGKCKAPEITLHPQPQTVVVGNDATFVTAATGFGTLAYQWHRNEGALPGATNSSLTLTNCQLADQGNYWVTVSNALGAAVSSSAWLQVNAPVPGVPYIVSVTPTTGAPGTNVTIAGFNFASEPANNMVYFGATRANVVNASANALTVTVPVGATFGPPSVTVAGAVGSAPMNFLPTFTGDADTPVSPATFALGQNLPGGDGSHRTFIADLDGDGWPDLGVANVYGHTLSMFRNLGTGAPLTLSTFAARVDFPSVGGASDNPFAYIAADADGDGKLDLLFTDRINHRVGIHRNQSSPGALTTGSFGPPVYFSTGNDPRYVRVGDLDGDGRPDIVVCNYGSSTVSILRNTGVAGTLDASSFAPRVDLASGAGACDVAIHDLDGDGRPDLAVANQSAAMHSLFRNIAVPGTLNAGSFAPRVDLPANGDITIAVGDLDGDGKPELVSGGIGTAISIFHNTSTVGSLNTASFAPKVDYGNPGWVHNVALGDVNGDGKLDIAVVGELGSYLRVYQNQSAPGAISLAGGVDFATGWNAWGVSMGDLDGDQRPDIAFCNAYDDSITLYRNLHPFNVPPFITLQPTNQTVTEGNHATLRVAAEGKLPLRYQWRLNGANVPDATNATLPLIGVQLNQAGDYSAQITNALGAITSAVATITVVTPTCAPSPAGIVGWWPGNGTTLDFAGTNQGTLTGNPTYGTGRVEQGFVLDGNGDGILVGNPASLQLQDFTIETWIKRGDAALATYDWQGTALFFGYGYGGYGVGLYNDGRLFLTRVGIDNVTLAAPVVTDTNWHHVAVTKSGTTVVFYIDGVAHAVPSYSTTYNFATSAGIGIRSDSLDSAFIGSIDEVAVYQRALSVAEVQSLHNAGSAGKCPLPPTFVQSPSDANLPLGSDLVLATHAVGSPPLSHQWYFNSTALTNGPRVVGVTNATLIVSNAQPADAGNYYVVLTSPYGSATSAVATVQVGIVPGFVQQPTNQAGVAGGMVQFVAAVSGNAPFTYRWYQNSTALSDDARHFGAATTNLVITNLTAGDAGNYTLRVTNAFGNAVSDAATLTVISPPSITVQPRGFSVPVGLPVTLSGGATGTAPVRYQWLLNGNPVSNATNPSLTISNLALADFGNYQLVATNGAGATTSAVAAVTVGQVGTWGTFTFTANAPLWPAAGLSNVIAVSAGSSYSLALRQDGTVHAWGFNNPATNVPAGLDGVVSIAAGQSHALALLSNGTVRAWGSSASGQIFVPPSLSNVVAVAAGSAHSAALRADGTMVVWGGNPVDGQTNIPPGLMKIVAIDAGGSQTLALREDGRLFGWGGRTQYPVPYDLKGVMDFSAGPAFSVLNLALTSNGLVRAWGGIGTATNVPASATNIVGVEGAGGGDQSTGVALALRSSRTVMAWGGPISASSLTNVPAALSNVLALSGGLTHALALVDDGWPLIIEPPVGGTFYSGRELALRARVVGNAPLSFQWFKNGNPIPGGTGETLVFPLAHFTNAGTYYLVASNSLGVAQSVPVPVGVVNRAPVLMSQPQSRFAYYGSPLSVGASVIGSGPLQLTWLQNGVPTYFGTNDLVFDRALPQHGGSYQLIASNFFGSITSSVAQITFSRVASWGNGPSLTNAPVDLGSVLGVASGYFHALAIQSNRTVVAWGTTLNGVTNVPAGLSDVVAVAGGNYFSVALKSDGTVVAWGLNNQGQTNVPAGLNDVISVSAGGNHALALRANGTVVAWGANSSGPASVPAGLSNVVAIAAGSVQSLALKQDGTIVGWGQFGKIPNYTNVVAIAAGWGQSLALQADGTVLAWSIGGGATGLPAGGITNAVAISMGGGWQGFSHGAALRPDGTVTMWGNNSNGQLTVPPELTSAIAISAGGGSTLAYLNDRSPDFPTPLTDRHSASGRDVTFAAMAVGEPALNYQWRLNGADIPGAMGPTLTLTNVGRDSRGLYSALVWNSLGGTNSRDAWLDVVGPVKLLPSVADGAQGFVSFVAADAAGDSLIAGDAAWLEVQASTNLLNWQTLTNSLVFTNDTLFLLDPAQTNFPSRFYRLIER